MLLTFIFTDQWNQLFSANLFRAFEFVTSTIEEFGVFFPLFHVYCCILVHLFLPSSEFIFGTVQDVGNLILNVSSCFKEFYFLLVVLRI